MTVTTFDTHSAVKRLMQTGVQEKQAEASKEQVTLLEKDVENIIQQVATKMGWPSEICVISGINHSVPTSNYQFISAQYS